MPVTSIPEPYVSCVGAGLTIGGTAWSTVEDGGFDYEVAVDEVTNNGGGGFYEDARTITKATGTFKSAWKTAGPPPVVEGTIYALVIDVPNGPYFSGNVRIQKSSMPVVDQKAAVHITFSWTSQGPITRTRPA